MRRVRNQNRLGFWRNFEMGPLTQSDDGIILTYDTAMPIVQQPWLGWVYFFLPFVLPLSFLLPFFLLFLPRLTREKTWAQIGFCSSNLLKYLPKVFIYLHKAVVSAIRRDAQARLRTASSAALSGPGGRELWLYGMGPDENPQALSATHRIYPVF